MVSREHLGSRYCGVIARTLELWGHCTHSGVVGSLHAIWSCGVIARYLELWGHCTLSGVVGSLHTIWSCVLRLYIQAVIRVVIAAVVQYVDEVVQHFSLRISPMSFLAMVVFWIDSTVNC